MKRVIVAAGAVLAAAATAQADIAAKPTPVFTRPVATGVPHTCDAAYPALAQRLGMQGQTTMHFTIREDGTVHDPVVTISSGSDLLDQASIDCAKGWTYVPATRDGTALAVPWVVRVEWYLHSTYEGPANDETPPAEAQWHPPIPRQGENHGCEFSFNQTAVHGSMPTGATVVQFTITPEGTTRDFVVTRASGSTLHDDHGVACAKVWHYTPATRNGVPVSVRWSATIPWGGTTSAQ